MNNHMNNKISAINMNNHESTQYTMWHSATERYNSSTSLGADEKTGYYHSFFNQCCCHSNHSGKTHSNEHCESPERKQIWIFFFTHSNEHCESPDRKQIWIISFTADRGCQQQSYSLLVHVYSLHNYVWVKASAAKLDNMPAADRDIDMPYYDWALVCTTRY